MEVKNKKLVGVLIRCLTSRFILKSRSRELFESIKSNLEHINSYFEQLGAEVQVDDNLGLARVVEKEDLKDKDLPQLGRKTELNPLETVALLYLRKRRMDYFSGDISEESPRISKTEINEFLEIYKTTADEGKFSSKLDRVIKNLSYWQVLSKKATNVYEITPVCELLLTPEKIKELKEAAEKYFENLKKFGNAENSEESAEEELSHVEES